MTTGYYPHGRAMFSDAALKQFREFVAVGEQTKHQRPRSAQDAMHPQLRRALKQTGVTPRQLGVALKSVQHAYDEMVGAPDPEAINAILEVLKQSLPDAGIVKIMKTLDAVWPGCCGELVEPGEHADDDFVDEKDMTDDDFPSQSEMAESDEPPGNYPNKTYSGKGSEAFRVANDDPPPFRGMPKPGGKMVPMASDSITANYYSLFPMAARIGLDNQVPMAPRSYGVTPQYVRPAHAKPDRKGMAMDAAERVAANRTEDDYAAMFGSPYQKVV